MGGDAFENTARLTEDEYTRICGLIKIVIQECGISGIRIGFPVEVKDKAKLCLETGKGNPYGDVDTIVGVDGDDRKSEVIKALTKKLGTRDETIIRNKKECHILTKERYQVDLLFCPPENFDFLIAFKGNNDFGALLGHLLTPFMLKWSDQGLILKLRCDGVSNIGTVKSDFTLTSNINCVCDFLSIPYFSLDGETRMSTREIFNVLTTCKIYFTNDDYDQKYKIKERRKRRPVADAFFTALEEDDNGHLAHINANKFQDDKAYNILTKYRSKNISYDEYVEKISDCFGKQEEVKEKLKMLRNQIKATSFVNTKFGYHVLKGWYPKMDQVILGKVLAKMKSAKSGAGAKGFQNWVEKTDIAEIRMVADKTLKDLDV